MSQPAEALFATKDQELLLKAALLKGQDAIAAWEEWKRTNDPEGHLDIGSFRLLPLLYMNLHQHRINDPLMSRLKGIYRLAWYENQKLFHYISEIIRYLQDAGIKTMLLKGAALTLLYHRNFGIRPMTDIDVLVPTEQAAMTIELLKKAGWRTNGVTPIFQDLRYRHSCAFFDDNGKVLDLHWRLLYESFQPEFDKDFWNGAIPVKMNDIVIFAMNRTDTLFNIIVHGTRGDAKQTIRWIADATSLINSVDANIDWKRLTNNAKRGRVLLRLKKALNYLHQKFETRIPVSILHDLNSHTVSPSERLEYRYLNRRWNGNSETMFFEPLPEIFFHYLRFMKGKGLLSTLAGFTDYLQYRLLQKDLRHLSAYIVSRSFKRIKGKLLLNRRTRVHDELWKISSKHADFAQNISRTRPSVK